MIKKFAEKYLEKNSIKYANKTQIKNECWHVEGIIRNRSNETLKFDIRNMDTKYKRKPAKAGYSFSKADKMVFELKKEWILIDMLEIQDLLKKGILTVLSLENLINELNWNIILPK